MKILVLFIAIFSFPLFGIGARPLSMGGTFVAVADDIHSIFYNPAGMATIKKGEASFMRVLKNRDSMNEKGWIGLTSKIKEGGIAGSYLHIINIDWENGYADLNNNGAREDNEPYLGADEHIAIFTIAGYGEGQLKKTAFGVNIKRYSSSLLQSYGITMGRGAGFSEFGIEKKAIGFDIGILHHISKNLSLGIVIYDLNEPKFVFENLNIRGNHYDLTITHPLILIVGIGLKPDAQTIMALDFYGLNNINDWYSKDENDRDQSSVRLGFERWILPNFAIRLGYGGGFHSAGFGIKAKNARFDYGLMEDKEGLGFHLVSFTIIN